MKIKKFIITISALSIIALSFAGINWFMGLDRDKPKQNSDPKVVNVEVKADGYDSLKELEDSSEIIVSGIKRGESDPVINRTPNGDPVISYVISDFEITNIVKDTSIDSVKENQVIQLMEYEFLDSESNTIYRIANYQNMVKDNQYVLFLMKSSTDDWYILKGLNFGKVPLQDETDALGIDSDLSKAVASVREEALAKYSYILK